MDGVAGQFQELRLQESPQLQRQIEEAYQQELLDCETQHRLCNLAMAQLKNGQIAEASQTEMQIAEMQLIQIWGPRAHVPWRWVPGMNSPWELSTPRQAQKVDVRPTLERPSDAQK